MQEYQKHHPLKTTTIKIPLYFKIPTTLNCILCWFGVFIIKKRLVIIIDFTLVSFVWRMLVFYLLETYKDGTLRFDFQVPFYYKWLTLDIFQVKQPK